MKGILKSLLSTIGVDYVMKLALISLLEALKELVQETDNHWDDRVVLPVVDAVILKLKGLDPEPALEAARPALERFAADAA